LAKLIDLVSSIIHNVGCVSITLLHSVNTSTHRSLVRAIIVDKVLKRGEFNALRAHEFRVKDPLSGFKGCWNIIFAGSDGLIFLALLVELYSKSHTLV